MASPPPTLSLPKKRPQLSLPTGAAAAAAPPPKRRKPSITSASSHPLRQTSFPPVGPPASSEVYSPGSLPDDYEDDEIASAVGSVAASHLDGVASSVASGRGSKGGVRGRGGRGGRGRARGLKVGLVEAGSAVSGEGRRGPGTAGGEDDEDDEGEDEDGDLMEGAGKLEREGLEEEKERRAMFLGSLLALAEDGSVAVPEGLPGLEEGAEEDEEVRAKKRKMREAKVREMAAANAQRYELWNRIHLKKEVVRRLTNQTLSQSVPQSVVTAISAYSKVFVGELVDRALGVQLEWTAARLKSQKETQDGEEEVSGVVGGGVQHVDVAERDIGPLQADHLREALRRYKADRDGGIVGFTGTSLEGRENTAARNGGRRLFK